MYKNATLLLTASVIRNAGQLVVFALFARLLGADAAGTFAFALAVTAPIFILASLGMRDIYLTLRTNYALTHYERLRAATLIVAVAVSVGVSFMFPMKVAVIVGVVACSKALDSFNDLYGAAQQKAARIQMTVVTALVVAILQVGTLAVALTFGATMPLALGISTLSYLIAVIFVVRPITLRGLPDERSFPGGQQEGTRETAKPPWVEIARVGFPTGISLGLITALSTLPQYFLNWTKGPADVGKYAVLLYLVVALEMALNALAQSWIPVGRGLEAEGALTPRRILGVALRWTIITVPLAFIGVAIATVAFPLILGPSYTISLGQAVPLGAAMTLTPLVFATTTALAIQNRYHYALVGSALTVLAGILIGWMLINPFGIVGALWTFAACLALRSGSALVFSKHEHFPSTRRTDGLEVA